MSKTIVVDLDDTICYPNHDYKDTYHKYVLALPNINFIQSLRIAKERGFRIIVFSARRMLTHNGDISAIEKDIGKITRSWLKNHGVPFDELIFGKPYGVYYIDDKAMLPEQFIDQMSLDICEESYA